MVLVGDKFEPKTGMQKYLIARRYAPVPDLTDIA
jgi:hypothetical protein